LSSTAPTLPPSGWKVLYDGPLNSWLTRDPRPSTLAIAPVVEWLRGCEAMGPPSDARPVRDDFYIAQLREARVTIEYLVVEHEFLMIIKRIS